MTNDKKLKLGIFDLTDCEGCQVEILSSKEIILNLFSHWEIINWRLTQEKVKGNKFDIILIEGTPLTREEISLVKFLRQRAKSVIALGTCATLGGIPAILGKKERKKWYKKIYGPKYRGRGIDALPLSAYIKVDFLVHGCPVNSREVIKVLQNLIYNKKLNYKSQSVCFECKINDLPCRLLENEICLGPITQSGCGAVCLKGGNSCYGCFGLKEGANLQALLNIFQKTTDKKEMNYPAPQRRGIPFEANSFGGFHSRSKERGIAAAKIKRYLSMFHSKTNYD